MQMHFSSLFWLFKIIHMGYFNKWKKSNRSHSFLSHSHVIPVSLSKIQNHTVSLVSAHSPQPFPPLPHLTGYPVPPAFVHAAAASLLSHSS